MRIRGSGYVFTDADPRIHNTNLFHLIRILNTGSLSQAAGRWPRQQPAYPRRGGGDVVGAGGRGSRDAQAVAPRLRPGGAALGGPADRLEAGGDQVSCVQINSGST